MSLAAIRACLETALAALSPTLPTAYENVGFDPVEGQEYQRVFLIPAEPENNEISPSYRERGILQISLCFPTGKGSAAASVRAEQIRDAFYRGRSIVGTDVVVTIERTPEIGGGFVDPNGRWLVPVRIRYSAPVLVA